MLIALCGYMGCGKSSVGKKLAEQLGYSFVDVDKFIEDNLQGMSINEVFAKYGEEYFREIESSVIATLANMENTVLSLGGGAVLREKNIALLKSAIIVYLSVSFRQCYNRIKDGDSRPIVNKLTREELEEHYNSRVHIYKKVCDIKVSNNYKSKMCVEDILKKLESFKPKEEV